MMSQKLFRQDSNAQSHLTSSLTALLQSSVGMLLQYQSKGTSTAKRDPTGSTESKGTGEVSWQRELTPSSISSELSLDWIAENPPNSANWNKIISIMLVNYSILSLKYVIIENTSLRVAVLPTSIFYRGTSHSTWALCFHGIQGHVGECNYTPYQSKQQARNSVLSKNRYREES